MVEAHYFYVAYGNRRREHAGHGWFKDHKQGMPEFPGRVFMSCPCGWFGWVDSDAVDRPKNCKNHRNTFLSISLDVDPLFCYSITVRQRRH